MADIRALKGVRYDAKALGSLGALREVVSPPYDVVDQEEQEHICTRSEFNVMRLLRRNCRDGHRPYRYAADEFRRWLSCGVLRRDEAPTVYVYEQEYSLQEAEGKVRHVKRLGFNALVKLADYSERVILPHENTIKAHMQDRFELMKAVNANLSSIFGLFDDDDGMVTETISKVISTDPESEFSDYDDTAHRTWLITDESVLNRIRQAMASKPVIIADGHHRYEAALRYRDWRRSLTPTPDPDAPYEYILMTFIPLTADGVDILPTHRMVRGLQRAEVDRAIGLISQGFRFTRDLPDVNTTLAMMRNISDRGGIGIGAYTPKHGLAVASLGRAMPETLDVMVLEDSIVGRMLGLGRGDAGRSRHLGFTHDGHKAVAEVDQGKYDMAFLLNPTPVKAVRDEALAGRIMPEKSTYFHPKLVAGLIINAL